MWRGSFQVVPVAQGVRLKKSPEKFGGMIENLSTFQPKLSRDT